MTRMLGDDRVLCLRLGFRRKSHPPGLRLPDQGFAPNPVSAALQIDHAVHTQCSE